MGIFEECQVLRPGLVERSHPSMPARPLSARAIVAPVSATISAGRAALARGRKSGRSCLAVYTERVRQRQ